MDLDLFSWAVGFWEAEGTVSWVNGKYLSIKANQKEREPLDRLAKVFGGTVNGPYRNGVRRNGETTTIYTWTLSRADNAFWIEHVLPHLSERRKIQFLGPSERSRFRKV